MKAMHRLPRKIAARGMSLIELMIAMVLGLIVAGAAVALFATNRLTYTATENMGRIQESSRVAFELLSRDLRDAGGVPCDSSLLPNNGLNSFASNWYTNWDNGIRGYNSTTAFTAPVSSAAFGTAQFNRVTGTDAIELKSAEPTDVVVSADVPDANRGNPIPVNNVTGLGLQLNDILVVCDYHGGTIFQVTTAPSGTTLIHATGAGTGGSPGNSAAPNPPYASTTYLQLGGYGNDKNGVAIPAMTMNSMISQWHASRWYVGCNGHVGCALPGGTSLFQARMVNNAGTYTMAFDEIASGVTAMNLEYLLSGATNYVDGEITPITNWSAVTAVKITLTFAGQNNASSEGTPITRTMQHVVTLRDRLP